MPIKGIHVVERRGRYYYRTHRGKGAITFWQTDGYRLDLNRPLPAEFVKAYAAAASDGPGVDTLGWLAGEYQRSRKFLDLSDETQRSYAGFIRRMEAKFLLKNRQRAWLAPLAVFDRKEIVPYIRAYQEGHESARSGDLAVNVLSQILKCGTRLGKLDTNRCDAVDPVYKRRKQVITWTKEAEQAFLSDCSDVLRYAFWFIRYTGMRRKDAVEMPLTADLPYHIKKTSSKSRYERPMLIPKLPPLQAIIDEMSEARRAFKVQPTTYLFNERGLPWTPSGLSTSFDKHRAKHNIPFTLHQLRKSAATDMVIWQQEMPDVITDEMLKRIFTWTDGDLEEMKAIYVDPEAVIRAFVKRTEQKR